MPSQVIDAAQENTAAQLCPSSLKSSLLVPLGYMGHVYHLKRTTAYHIALHGKASSLFAHPPCAQNQSDFALGIFATFSQCTMPCWSMNHKVTFPRADLSGCVIPVPLHTTGLGLSAGLRKPLTQLHHFILLHGI